MENSKEKVKVRGFPLFAMQHAFETIWKLPSFSSKKIRNVYHYTTTESATSILKNKGFWLSDSRLLNDREELHNGKELCKKIIKSFLEKNEFNNTSFNDILRVVWNRLKNENTKRCFLCSFSSVPDNLDQWRAYSTQDAGVSLGFDISENTSYPHFDLHSFNEGPRWGISPVVYDEQSKIEIIYKVTETFKVNFEKEPSTATWINIISNDYSEYLFNTISYILPLFKNPSFNSENEIRLISRWDGKNGLIHHRYSRGLVVPYICTYENIDTSLQHGFPLDLLPLKKITIGPSTKHKDIKEGLRVFLGDLGYSDEVQIVRSRIPYRG